MVTPQRSIGFTLLAARLLAPLDLSARDLTVRDERIDAAMRQLLAGFVHAESERRSPDAVLAAMGVVVVGAGTLDLFALLIGLGRLGGQREPGKHG